MHADHIEKYDQGVVIKKSKGVYEVFRDDRRITCSLSSRLFGQPGKAASVMSDSLAVGDVVHFVEISQGAGQILGVLPRRNRLARRAVASRRGAYAGEQVIAANIDQVVPVFAAARPEPHWRLLDRYLVAAEAAELPCLVCITKLDLAQNGDGSIDIALRDKVEEYRRIGYALLLVSAVSGAGMAEFKQALQGRASLLLGKSGGGKTSLLNAGLHL